MLNKELKSNFTKCLSLIYSYKYTVLFIDMQGFFFLSSQTSMSTLVTMWGSRSSANTLLPGRAEGHLR